MKTYLLICSKQDANMPAHPRSLIRVFVVHLKNSCIFGYSNFARKRFWSDCENAQADLNIRWAHMSEGTFSDVAALIYSDQAPRL